MPFLRAVRDIRRPRYDLAALVSSSWRIAAALAFARIPARVGRERRRNRYWLTTTLPPEDRSRPVVSELAGIARALGAEPPTEYRLDAAPLASRRASLQNALGTRPPVALHAFAGSRARCVALSEWRMLAESLVRRGMAIVWIGAPPELDEIRASGTSPHWFFADAIGDGTLRDAIALITLCTAFVGHDSGPMHIASALAVPVVGIFAPGEPQRTFPQGPAPARVIARQSPLGITSELMLRELDALLSRPSPTVGRR